MKVKKARILGVGLSTLAVAVAAFWIGKGLELRSQGVAVQPFMTTLEDSYYSGTNLAQPSRTEYYTVAVRGDGSQATVKVREFPDHNSYRVRGVLDLSESKRFAIDQFTESVSTYPLSPRMVAAYRAMTAQCEAAGVVSTSNMLGYKVVETVRNGKTPHGSFSLRRWEAPAIGCFPLLAESQWTDATNGTVTSKHVLRAVALTPGDAPAALFDVPSGYTERSPSQVFAIFQQTFHTPDHPPTDVALDQIYDRAQSQSR